MKYTLSNKSFRNILFAAILVVGVALSIIVSAYSYYTERKLIQTEFYEATENRYSALKREIDINLSVLASLQALYYTSGKDVERSEFRSFTNHILKQHASIQALEWIPRVPDSRREAYERAARREGFPDFQFTEPIAKGRVKRKKKQKEYFPVYFVEPYKGKEIALGFDSSNPERVEAMEAAGKTGEIRASARTTLVQETKNQFGFLIVAPIYRKGELINSDQARWDNLEGFAQCVFRISDMIEKATSYLKPEGIDFFIYDASAPEKDRFLYAHSSRTRKTPLLNPDHPDTDVINSKTLEVAGRKWMVTYSATPDFIAARSSWRPLVLLLSGLTFTGLVVGFFISVSHVEHVEKYAMDLSDTNINLAHEIMERKKAEEKIKDSEEQLRESQIIAGLGSYTLDIPTGLSTTSDVLDELFGIDETYQRSVEGWAALVHPDDRTMIGDYLRSDVIGRGETFDREYRIIRYNDHAERWVHGLGKVEFDVQGRPLKMHGTIQDITDRKKLEEHLRQSQKLEAIGELAGGIAHDFNNLLQGVFGYISLAKLNADNKDKIVAALEQAEKALHMSVNLTTQLLTFSKGGKPIKKKFPLYSVIENSVKFALSGSGADYRIKLDEDLWHVEADEGQIGQVIQNIVLNAEQSMPMGGTIMITAKNLLASGDGIPHLPEEGKYVEISIKDSGTGISEEYLSKIFDPFFTTKTKGSGLGLATCYNIIKNHGGVIHASSKPGKGTTLNVYLPAVEAEKESPQISEPSPFIRKGRILLMDDEELIRDVAGKMIEVFGHEIDYAEHGEAAIEKYKAAMESGNPFDIVILDLTIRGGMGGKETVEQLLAVDPKIKAIVSSGYSDDAMVSDFRNYGFSARLTKPYKLQELGDTLNNLLSR